MPRPGKVHIFPRTSNVWLLVRTRGSNHRIHDRFSLMPNAVRGLPIVKCAIRTSNAGEGSDVASCAGESLSSPPLPPSLSLGFTSPLPPMLLRPRPSLLIVFRGEFVRMLFLRSQAKHRTPPDCRSLALFCSPLKDGHTGFSIFTVPRGKVNRGGPTRSKHLSIPPVNVSMLQRGGRESDVLLATGVL